MASEPLIREIRDLIVEIRRQGDLGREHHEINLGAHELNRKQAAELAQGYQDQLQITREVVRRNEIAFQEQRAVMAELVAEVKAMREGMFALIDELRGGGASPATS
jgi:hypothetical protein